VRLRRAGSGLLPLFGLLLGCEPGRAPLDNKSCPCVLPYTCCATEKVCLGPDQVCVDAGLWPVSTAPTAPLPLDDVTVFAFSQVDTNGGVNSATNVKSRVDDPQLLDLAPDMVIRAWAQWGHYGVAKDDFQFPYINRCHNAGIRYFMGGATATMLFREQVSDKQFDDMTTRDDEDNQVPHTAIADGAYRATLANPAFRKKLVEYVEAQIDGGVDGLHFEEINGAYQGADFLGNEGFDDYHLADFNAYLQDLSSKSVDFAARNLMTGAHRLRFDVPAGDLKQNFNYRAYLHDHGWSGDPFAADNPLAKVWGRTTINRPKPGAETFVDSAEPYRYWKEIVDQLRDYAWTNWNRKLLITAEGIYPFVDFQSVGLDDNNTDSPDGNPIKYLPLTDDRTHLDGTQSLQLPFRHLKEQSERFAPGAPVVLFFDGRWNDYDNLASDGDRQDFWRLYAAEAYANGLFFAFQLKSSVGGDNTEPNATQLGVMPLFKTLAAFYRAHSALYHGVAWSPAPATTLLPGAMIAVNDQPRSKDDPALGRRLVHIVNHQYQPGTGIIPQPNVRVAIASDVRPETIMLASPDLPRDAGPLPFDYDGATVIVTIDNLVAYDVIILSY
jgi:hypothetical protein